MATTRRSSTSSSAAAARTPTGDTATGRARDDQDVRPRHLCPAVRPPGDAALPRARRRAARWSWSPSSRASGTTPSWATSPGRRCGCWTTCGSARAGWTRRCRSARAAAPCTSSSTTPTRSRCPPASAWATTTAGSSPSPRTSPLEGRDVTLVSKDLPMRVKASAVGLDAEEYRAEITVDSGWTGMAELDVTVEEMDALYDQGRVEHAVARELPCHTGLVLLSPARQRPGPGRRGQAASAWSAATATRSACTAAAPSSGSPSTCCWTPTWASSASVAAPAPARARSRCAPASRR